MSLKAKIEAVIYASEEPVTLAQLVGLLGLEAQSELEAMDARQASLLLTEDEPEEVLASEQEPPAEEEIAVEVEAGEVTAANGEYVVGDGSAVELRSIPHPDNDEAVVRMGHPGEVTPEARVAEPADSAAEKKATRERERKLRDYLRGLVDELVRDYATSERGLEVREVAGGYRMATKPEYHDAVRGFVKSLKPPLKLSLQALETLAVVAYKQPVTAPEITEIRGVDSGGVLGSLLARKLITTAGRKQVIGRPILYKTTKDFLVRFGLKDVAELPSIEEFEKMAGELAEQEEIPMADAKETAEERITHENLEEEAHVTEPQADGDSDDLNTDDSNRPNDELPAVDGRLSGLPPREDVPGDDPSADEAAIQKEGEAS